jgi:hypothetical protein
VIAQFLRFAIEEDLAAGHLMQVLTHLLLPIEPYLC